MRNFNRKSFDSNEVRGPNSTYNPDKKPNGKIKVQSNNQSNATEKSLTNSTRDYSSVSCDCKRKTTGPNLYDVQYLTSDPNAGIPTPYLDLALINPWGLAHSPTGPWNVVNNGTSIATEYYEDGDPFPAGLQLQIFIESNIAPTGNVFNHFALLHPSEFLLTISSISVPGIFFYAAENGTVSGWNDSLLNNTSVLVIDNSGSGANYKGITMLEHAGSRYLYVTNFTTGLVEMYDSMYVLVTTFTDPNLAGYSPFNIQAHCGKLYVTFALQDANHEDAVPGAGNGYVVVFDWEGNVLRRLISGGNLNAPWGLAWAPECFGAFGCRLLVANFGDGKINAYNNTTGQFVGTLQEESTNLPIVIDGLWGIQFGNGELAGSKKHLYFTAGTNGEMNGVFGRIKVY